MKKRTLTTITLWTLVIVILSLFGVYGGIFLLILLSGVTQYEIYKILRKMGGDPLAVPGLIAGSLLILASGLLGTCSALNQPVLLTTGLILPLLVLLIILTTPARLFTRRLFPTLLGFFLAPFCLVFLIALATHPVLTETQGMFLAVWVVAVAKFSDMGALLVGMAVGRNRLAPDYSPKKTVEGALGGIAASALVAVLLVLFFPAWVPLTLNWWIALLFGIAIAIVAIASDLFGSALKRQVKIKDSGANIPGIGGGLDLTDSLLFSSPFAFALFAFIL